MPVWADAYGTEKQKSIWLTILLLASPMGVIIGYTMTFYMINYYSWEWSFYLQALLILPCVAAVLLTPTKYLDISFAVYYRLQCQDLIKSQDKSESVNPNHFDEMENQFAKNKKDRNPRARALSHEYFQDEKETLSENLRKLADNRAFWCLCLCLTGLFFVVTGIQYWLPTYLTSVYKLPKEQAAVFYSTLSITAPIFGVIIGGIGTTWLGGYNTIKAQRLQQLLGIMAVFCVIPIPFANFKIFAVLIWLVLFFGGSLLPSVTGIMLNSVEERKRTAANSVANLCYNLLGYAPAPSFYGLVSSLVNDEASTVPMACLLYSTLISVSLLLYGINLKIDSDMLKMQVQPSTGETHLQITLLEQEKISVQSITPI